MIYRQLSDYSYIYLLNTIIDSSTVDIIFLFHFKKFNKTNELFN